MRMILRCALLALSVSLMSCSRSDVITIRDGQDVLATVEMTGTHDLLAEYDRKITLRSKAGSKTLPLPPDTGGDLPITITRHREGAKDLLKLRGGIYLLVFDLKTQNYAAGSDSPANEIYTGEFRGEIPSTTVSEWRIDRDLKVTKMK